MFPGMNPKMMKQAMKRMGIQQAELDATEVIIKLRDKELVITSPQVSKVNMMGQETFQIVGEVHERERQASTDITPDDVKTVMDQTGATEAMARSALQTAKGDIAEAILQLQERGSKSDV